MWNLNEKRRNTHVTIHKFARYICDDNVNDNKISGE